MKRSRSSTLTGGSGDVNPQLYSSPILTLGDPNEFDEISFPTPVSRLNNRSAGTKATVMEVLKIWCNLSNPDADISTSFGRLNSQLQVSTSSMNGIGVAPQNPKVIAFFSRTYLGKAAGGGTWVAVNDSPMEKDLTDGNGHGILVATDSLFISADTAGFTAVGAFNIKILYRFKDVGIQEYIGIVQSQQ